MTTDYRPISCDRHSEYELMAMRNLPVRLDAGPPGAKVRGLVCRVVDVYTRDGAEFLQVQMDDGGRRDFRLDWLVSVVPLGGGAA
jgi:transcriptional antiterminator Rof (Rho-off)